MSLANDALIEFRVNSKLMAIRKDEICAIQETENQYEVIVHMGNGNYFRIQSSYRSACEALKWTKV